MYQKASFMCKFCCFVYQTYCFFDVLVAVAVIVVKAPLRGALATTKATAAKTSRKREFALRQIS